MPTYQFGDDNTIAYTPPLIQIRLKNGGNWSFTIYEIIQLVEILSNYQLNNFPPFTEIWRINGFSRVNIKNELGYVRFEEDQRQGHFLSGEADELVDKITQNIITPTGKSFPFGENVINVYRGSGGVNLYALVLQAIRIGKGIWIFNRPELGQLENIMKKFPANGEVNRSNGSRVVVTGGSFVEFREGIHISEFEGGQLYNAILQVT